MYKIKLHKTSKWLWPLHIDMYVVKWMGFFRRFHKSLPKIHRNVLRKITIDLLYFWDVYDVNLWGKNSGRSTVNQAEAVFPITYFKAEAVIGRRFYNVAFLHLSKPGEMPVIDFILVVYLSVLPACHFTKGWTPCQIIYRVYDHKSW